jgi:shikimate kinase
VQGPAASGYLLKKAGKTAKVKPVARVQPRRLSAPAPVARNNAVFLVGFMGAGKTSVGRALGQRLNWVFEDLDDRIVAHEGRTVAEIFRDSGETEFRRAEHEVLQELLNELRGGVYKIVALGGGTFVQPENHKVIRESGILTAFLNASLPELWRRCVEQRNMDTQRPLQSSENRFRELHKERLRFYKTADKRFDTEGKSVETIAAEIAERLGLRALAMRTEQGEAE